MSWFDYHFTRLSTLLSLQNNFFTRLLTLLSLQNDSFTRLLTLLSLQNDSFTCLLTLSSLCNDSFTERLSLVSLALLWTMAFFGAKTFFSADGSQTLLVLRWQQVLWVLIVSLL